MVLGKPARESESLVRENENEQAGSGVLRDTRNLAGSRGDHPPRLNTTQWPIAHSTVKERWKGPREGSEREPETLCLQAVEELYMLNRVLFVERSGELLLLARLRTKGLEPKGNQVLIGRRVSQRGPETGWSTHVQDEAAVRGSGGPNTHPLKRVVMRCG